MAASTIAISFDSSDESVGSSPSWVILFGDIHTVIPSTSIVAPETSTIALVISSAAPIVKMTLVTSPTRLCGLVPYSDSDSPDEMDSPEYITPLPATSLFLYTDSSEASDSSDGPPSQDPYVATVARRPYRTRPNGPRRVMTARNRVGPLPARRLAWRLVSPRSSDHRPSSSSSSSDSLPVHSSGMDAPDQAHSGSSTRDSSLGGSSKRPLHSSSHLARPSRKRCRSPVDYVPSSTPVMGSLAPTRVDLLPPRKRFIDSYSSEASIEEDTEIDSRDVRDDTEEYEADTSAGDTVEVGIDPMSASIVEEEIVEPAGEDSSDSSAIRDGIVRSFEDMPIDLDDVVRDFYLHMSEVRIDRIVGVKTVQIRLEADQLIARGKRARMIERIESLRLVNLKVHAMLDIERDRVNCLRLHISLSQEEFRLVRRDRDDTRGRLRRIEEMINQHVDAALEARRVNRDLGLENGNDNGGGDGNGNDTGNGNNCGDNSDGNENRTEGVVGLIRWSEKMETVFHISNCLERYQVKYATCTLLDSALTWWNSHKRTIGTDAAYALSWRELLKLMTEVYCPRNEI
ncbi:hypothetical protein Tco_0975900 [Tanacetum coccineum]|uniref:Reverse transcriptase domain-containing protein n=1 Tax=Tanacetum coccineum TaxID=301880 RepID=A0ABQ5EFP7_9ASTR